MIPHPRPIPTVSRAQSHAVGPQIQTIETAERLADLSNREWLIVAWRYKRGGAWQYYLPADEIRTWDKGKASGKFLVTQRDDGSRWSVLGRVARP